jgi:hypothetical protein
MARFETSPASFRFCVLRAQRLALQVIRVEKHFSSLDVLERPPERVHMLAIEVGAVSPLRSPQVDDEDE